jgi:hypothetical protein
MIIESNGNLGEFRVSGYGVLRVPSNKTGVGYERIEIGMGFENILMYRLITISGDENKWSGEHVYEGGCKMGDRTSTYIYNGTGMIRKNG